jgi:hypothetical protein
MGQKKLLRGKLMEMVKQEKLRLKVTALAVKVSYQQGKRLYAAYLSGGGQAFIHGNAGRLSNRRLAEQTREQALNAYRQRYSDFGLVFAAEKPGEEEGDTAKRGHVQKMADSGGAVRRQTEAAGIPQPTGTETVFWETGAV